jgi:hypothetical protein
MAVALDAMALRVAREVTAQRAGRPWKPNDETPIPPKLLAMARKELDATLGIMPTTAPVTDEWYWEEYAKQQGPGTEFLGFVRMVLPTVLHQTLSAKLYAKK